MTGGNESGEGVGPNSGDPREPRLRTVGETAHLLGVSVRTLHHWDAVGLAAASERSWSGYRLYTPADLERLHRVLVYRETGMPLAQVREVLEADGSEREHLLRQREALAARIDRLQQMVRAVDSMMERTVMGEKLSPEARAEILGTDWNPEWDREAEEKYGDTDDWKTSAQRQANMSARDFEAATERMKTVEKRLAEAMKSGVQPGSGEANALAEEHRASLVWFDVTHAKHVLIARGYVADPRFAKHYESIAPGLGAWLKTVIDENARAHGVDPDTAEWE